MIFFIADTHFDHNNIIDLCQRPFRNIDHMNTTIITKWNLSVGPEDEVFILGDFFVGSSFKRLERIVNSLNGTKHLILGNHDTFKKTDYLRAGFSTVDDYKILNNILYIYWKKEKGTIYLAHDPTFGNIFIREPHKQLLIHGHIHNLHIIGNSYLNVCVERISYKPISLDEINNIRNLKNIKL